MEKSFLDIYVDELKDTLQSIRFETQQMFRGKKPFRMEKMTPEQRIDRFLQITPDMEAEMRQSFGDDAYDKYKFNMNDEILRRQRNAR